MTPPTQHGDLGRPAGPDGVRPASQATRSTARRTRSTAIARVRPAESPSTCARTRLRRGDLDQVEVVTADDVPGARAAAAGQQHLRHGPGDDGRRQRARGQHVETAAERGAGRRPHGRRPGEGPGVAVGHQHLGDLVHPAVRQGPPPAPCDAPRRAPAAAAGWPRGGPAAPRGGTRAGPGRRSAARWPACPGRARPRPRPPRRRRSPGRRRRPPTGGPPSSPVARPRSTPRRRPAARSPARRWAAAATSRGAPRVRATTFALPAGRTPTAGSPAPGPRCSTPVTTSLSVPSPPSARTASRPSSAAWRESCSASPRAVVSATSSLQVAARTWTATSRRPRVAPVATGLTTSSARTTAP